MDRKLIPLDCVVCQENPQQVRCSDCELSYCDRCFTTLHQVAARNHHLKEGIAASTPPKDSTTSKEPQINLPAAVSPRTPQEKVASTTQGIEANEASEVIALKTFNVVNTEVVQLEAEIDKLNASYSSTPSAERQQLTERTLELQNSLDPMILQRENALSAVFLRSPVLRERITKLSPPFINVPGLWAKSFEKLKQMAAHYELSLKNAATLHEHILGMDSSNALYATYAKAMEDNEKYIAKLQSDRYDEFIKLYTSCEALRTKVLRALPS